MKIIYDPIADALSITFRKGRVKKTLEIAPEVVLDVDAGGRPLYLEILGARKKLGKAGTEEITLRNVTDGKKRPRTLAPA